MSEQRKASGPATPRYKKAETQSEKNSAALEKKNNLLKLKYVNFLSANFFACRKEKLFCDVKLKIGEKIFECHRLILASNSKFFRALFKDEFEDAKEEVRCLSTEYVDVNSFSKLLNAMYGEPLEFNTDWKWEPTYAILGKPLEFNTDWVPIFTTSMFLQLTHFIDLCEQYLVENLDLMNVVELIMLPELKLSKDSFTLVKKTICRDFPKYYSRLAGISLDVLEELLSDPELFVMSTKQLFDFGKNWITHDIKNRKQHLQLVASYLKPFHTSSEKSLKIVAEMGNLLENEYAVQICLKTLMESSDTHQHDNDNKLKLDISGSLFFIQPNDESEVLFGTYENESWVFLNEFQVPISTALLNSYDSAVANDMLYFVAEDASSVSSVTFHGSRKGTQEWIELMPPRNMPKCLIPCSSKLYLYEEALDDYQFSVFEPTLNRWLKVPAVNYPRRHAGIATDNDILYMVGGKPLKTISSEMPTNIVEMYDSRCGRWSRIIVTSSSDLYEIPNHELHRKVCFSENTLFILDEEELFRIDYRNRKILKVVDLEQNFVSDNWYLTVNSHKELWIVDVSGEHSIEIYGTDGGEKKTSLSHPNVFVRPILVPWL